MAMNIISKEKKEIKWLGLPTNSLQEFQALEAEKQRRLERIKQKTQQLQELVLQQIAFKSLVGFHCFISVRHLFIYLFFPFRSKGTSKMNAYMVVQPVIPLSSYLFWSSTQTKKPWLTAPYLAIRWSTYSPLMRLLKFTTILKFWSEWVWLLDSMRLLALMRISPRLY